MQIYPSDTQRSLFMKLISGKPLPRSQYQLSGRRAVQLLSRVNTTLEWVRTQLYRWGISWPSNQTDGVSICATTPTPPSDPPIQQSTYHSTSKWVSEWVIDWLMAWLGYQCVAHVDARFSATATASATAIPYAIVLHINQSAEQRQKA